MDGNNTNVMAPAGTMTLTDNASGKSIELPVIEGSIVAFVEQTTRFKPPRAAAMCCTRARIGLRSKARATSTSSCPASSA